MQLTDLTGLLASFSEPWSLILFLLSLLLTHYLLPHLVVHYKKEQLYRRLPSPVTSPILGRLLGHLELYWNAPANLKNLSPSVWFYHFIDQLVRPIQESGESLFLLRFSFFYKCVMLLKGDVAKALLSSSKHLAKSPEYSFFKEFSGENLVNGNLAGWKVRRKLLAPSFHLEILHKFLPVMNAHSRIFCQVITSQMDPSTGRALLPDIRQLTFNCAHDILSETIMGVTLNSQPGEGDVSLQARRGATFADLLFTGLDLFCERVMRPWLYPDALFALSPLGRKARQSSATLRQFTGSLIGERKDALTREMEDCGTVEGTGARPTAGRRHLSLLDFLLVSHLKGDEGALDLPSIDSEVLEFLVAGIDTTATTLQMALLLLGLHAEKQALLHAELDTIFAADDDDERHLSLEDLRQMTYLEMCIKEVLRLYPVLPIIGRTLSEDMQMGKHLVPEGTTVFVNIAAINRDPGAWTQADDFLPERFSPNSTQLGHSAGTLSFSAGRRNCLGSRFAMLELKIILATLFRRYTVHSLTAQTDVQLGFFFFAKPNASISIEFTQRK